MNKNMKKAKNIKMLKEKIGQKYCYTRKNALALMGRHTIPCFKIGTLLF